MKTEYVFTLGLLGVIAFLVFDKRKKNPPEVNPQENQKLVFKEDKGKGLNLAPYTVQLLKF